MIESDNRLGTFEIFCDFCEAYESYDTGGDFMEFMNSAKSDGWFSKKKNDVWIHFCPECVKTPN